jgi:adenylate cyclase
MTRLLIHLLGPFQVILDGQPVIDFESDKVRALLAYLALEADQPHRREKLAGLLWPEWTERSARANLRRALVNLRKVIDDYHAVPPFLSITPKTIRFNRGSDARVDVGALKELVVESPLDTGSQAQDESVGLQHIHRWEDAVALYEGAFLEGFSLAGCPDFEEWVLLEQESLHRLLIDRLRRLVTWHETHGDLDRALVYAQRQVELDPWWESGYQQIMRILAHSGKRTAALAQYETCRSRLAAGLGVEPSAETTQLYERVKQGRLEPLPEKAAHGQQSAPAGKPPRFLTSDAQPSPYQPPLFVARERELARLDDFLRRSTRGEGNVVFVSGGPGRGKTALLNEFARRAMAEYPNLLVASGCCNAYSGVGDPYLPFCEVMGMLTGDVESLWAAGAIDQGHARRLWEALPTAIQALLQHGPQLVPALVSGETLLARTSAAPIPPNQLGRLRESIAQRQTRADGLEQSHLFQQLINVLRALAEVHPLLLILDDLQWIDRTSAGLLFHLGRRLEGARILIAGAYRPEEIALRREGELHPLEKVLAEFRCTYGGVWLDLADVDESEGRRFVDALLETEPNCLGEGFRRALFDRARGHPLFTIELLRAMQDRGDLVRDEAGHWVEGPTLDWETLPARVEGVIAARLEQVRPELQQVMAVASVEGEEFTAEVVARVQGMDAHELVQRLSDELYKEHRLVRTQELRLVGSRRLALYRFRHHLLQQYLYHSLDVARRAYLHEEVATALEALWDGYTDEVAVPLAWHFLEAGVADKAVGYLGRAGELAAARYANEEAVEHLSKALTLLPETDLPGRYDLLLAREQVYHLLGQRDVQRRDLGELQALAQRLGVEQQAEVAVQWARYAADVGDYSAALASAQVAVEQARAVGDCRLQARGHLASAAVLFFQSDLAAARGHAEAAQALAQAAGLPSVEAHTLLYLGCISHEDNDFPCARHHFEQALRFYQEIGDPRGAGSALYNLGVGCCEQGDYAEAWACFQQTMRFSREGGDRSREAFALRGCGKVCYLLGEYTEAQEYYEQSLRIAREIENRDWMGVTLNALGELHRRVGDYVAAQSCAGQALSLAHQGGAVQQEARALTLLGGLHEDQGDQAAARECYEQALRIRVQTGSLPYAMGPRAGLASVALALGDAVQAQAQVAEILAYLAGGGVLPADDRPFGIYLTCYQVLQDSGDPRAAEILATAHSLLHEHAARTPNEARRRSFLENVEENQEIVRLAREANLTA